MNHMINSQSTKLDPWFWQIDEVPGDMSDAFLQRSGLSSEPGSLSGFPICPVPIPLLALSLPVHVRATLTLAMTLALPATLPLVLVPSGSGNATMIVCAISTYTANPDDNADENLNDSPDAKPNCSTDPYRNAYPSRNAKPNLEEYVVTTLRSEKDFCRPKRNPNHVTLASMAFTM